MKKRNTFIFGVNVAIIVLTAISTSIYSNDARSMDILPNNINVKNIIIDPYNTNILYAGIEKNGLYRSADNGENWTYIGTKLPRDDDISVIAIDPAEKVVYVGTPSGLYVSHDDDNWKYSAEFRTYRIFLQPAEPSNVIYLSTFFGLYVSTVERAWKKASTPFPNVELVPAAMDTSDPGIVYFIMTKPDDVGIYFVDDAGIKREWNDFGVYKSDDHGETLKKISSIKLGNFLISPSNKNVMFGTDGKKLLKSIDGGASWNEKEISIIESNITKLVMNPINNNILYAITSYYHGTQLVARLDYSMSRIFKSIDNGETWQIISDFPVNTIAINPSNPDILYAGTQCGIFKSTNAGQTWEAQNNGIKPNR